MSAFFKMDVTDNDLLNSVQDFFRSMLESDKINALMIPCHLPYKNIVMPSLIIDPENLDKADPLAPSFPINAAKIASKLTKIEPGETIALVMRSCEIRAFVELVKLKQGTLDDVIIVGIDCLGAFTNTDYADFTGEDPLESTRMFSESILTGKSNTINNIDLAGACRVCEHPVPANADIIIGLYGVDYKNHFLVEAASLDGEKIIQDLGFSKIEEPSGRKKAISSLVEERITRRDQMFDDVSKATSSIEKLSKYLAGCVNCYNCRVACPVCYCRECVFVTDVFDHEPYQYLQWAKQKGKIKLPTDTDFFHITRMAHIGLTCVGCGQCSNACPNDIPLMELFRTISHHAQKGFDYEPGKSIDEPMPLSVFRDKEYEDVVGIKSAEGV